MRLRPVRGGFRLIIVAMSGIKPQKVERLDFIVAGAQKSGTTALHYFLSKHPEIALPDKQELHFFDDEERFAGEANYNALHGSFHLKRRWKNRIQKALPLQSRLFSYVDRGFYSEQLARLFKFFPREQIKIIKSEEFRDKNRATLDSVFRFLGVQPLIGRRKDRKS